MDWITGIQNAINYIEDHLTEEIDYDRAARESFSSSFHFQRVFSILSGYTLGEYIRNRRLSLAGAELATGKEKVIDIAAKYGYESPDSFAKAFQKFHGITPSQARSGGAVLKNFSRLSFKITLEGGSIMNYKIVEREELVLTGFKRHFTGTPSNRGEQDSDFWVNTRLNQYVLEGLAHDCETTYEVLTNFGDNGYDFYIATYVDPLVRSLMKEELGEFADRFEHITIPAGLYLVCETERCRYPTDLMAELRNKAVTEWLPSAGYELTDAPEITVAHWYYEYQNDKLNDSRYVELWLPIVKK